MGVVGTQCRFLNGEGALERRLGLGQFVELHQHAPQLEEVVGHHGMVGTEYRFIDLQGALNGRSGQREIAQELHRLGQTVERDGNLVVIRSMRRLHHRHETLVQDVGLGVFSLANEKISTIAEGFGLLGERSGGQQAQRPSLKFIIIFLNKA